MRVRISSWVTMGLPKMPSTPGAIIPLFLYQLQCHDTGGRLPGQKPLIPPIPDHPDDACRRYRQRHFGAVRSRNLLIHKEILQLLTMPLQARWAEPVSRTPVPHGQRATQPVRVHHEHRATVGSAFDRLAALEREEARALFTELDRSGNRERSEEHTSELQSRLHLVCRLLLEKKKKNRETT